MRLGLLAVLTALVVAGLILAFGTGRGGNSPSSTAGRTATAPSPTVPAGGGCQGTVSLGMLAPLTGASASLGTDQLHWAEFFFDSWNDDHTPKVRIVRGDTQADPSVAATVAQQFASDHGIVGVIGPAGSDEVEAVAPILRQAGLGFVSGSAIGASLTGGDNRGFFFRVVPSASLQAPTDVAFMTKQLGVAAGDTVLVVDDGEAYSTGLADAVEARLKARGVTVARTSVSQTTTDFSSLVARIGSKTKVVFLPFQLASEAQLFAQELRAQHRRAIVFGGDRTFDSSKFTVEGSYISFFAPDADTVPADAAIAQQFHKRHRGESTAFGLPNYIAAQIWAAALHQACVDGSVSRASVRALLPTTSLSTSLLGTPVAFTPAGEVEHARFHIFRVVHGRYVTVQ